MKNKIIKITFVFLIIFTFTQVENVLAKSEYKLLETMPGVGEAGQVVSFPDYINKLYIFVFSAIAISAFLMLTIGGFYYIASAGNKSLSGTAKKIITDALFGLIVAFLGWLIFNTINPDLMKADLDFGAIKVESSSSSTADSSWNKTKASYDKMHEDMDEIEKSEEERKNRADIFAKPDVDPDREPYSEDAMTDDELEEVFKQSCIGYGGTWVNGECE